MTGEWRKVKLGEVVSINPDTIGADWRYPYIKYIDISSVGEGMIVEPPRILRLDEMPSRARRLVQEGDTVLSTVRPGRRAMFFVKHPEPEWVVSTGFAVLRPKREYIEPRYLYACVFDKEFTDFLVQREKGAAYPAVLPEDIADAVISLPPPAEQRAIAHILGALDDKIELNRRMSDTLEAIAHALFKAWFVDFEPVRAKLEGRWRRGHSLPGLPAHLYDHFPDRLVESELGEIPEGWRIDKIGNQFRVTMGQSPPGNTYNEKGNGLPFYQGRADFGFRFPNRRVFCTAPTRFAEPGDTLVTVRAPVGDTNIALERCCIGRGVAAIRHSSGATSYTYYLVRSLRSVFRSFEAEGTVFGAITKDSLLSIKHVVPPDELVQRFEQLCSPIDDMVEIAERESRTLAALRDALLPKLIRGEIRVKDAERFLEGKGYEVRPRETSPSQYAPERV
jgi:type I restriction enzyme, S subunit